MKGIRNGVAFITGGENGLGAAISKKFAEEGAKVIIFGIDEINGNKVAEECNKLTEGAMFIKGDVTNNDDIKNAMNIIKDKYVKLDFAVNNAGVTGGLKDFNTTSIEQYDFIMNINVKGVFLCMQNEIKMMLENKAGKIVNVSSEAGTSAGFAGLSVYVGSKHAVNGLTKAAAIENAPNGININAIAPGTMSTPLVLAFPQKDQDALASIRPSNRLVDVESVANAAVYLCSDYSNDMVGTILPIDGGNTIK
ncbi:SDR family oxidoreductase [uncultured Ilyobacter sp.]|uniref:SDR family NAD(P)-dependent oxidoreductase n=1 Tax=uncultured Ilyobacter sp. TaxID=544433 RepID=UPI002AA7FC14|nr:SDR family oxidoreductase [uncultured Ilyobacter sp.]